jgi:hypothetical protein
MWKTIFAIGIFVGLGALVFIKHITNAINEYYSPGFVSESISEARSHGVFISQPNLKRNVIHWRKSEYLIREAWFEQATRIKYNWIFFKRVIPTNYRLVLKIERTGNPPGEDFLHFSDEILCNNFISITTTRFSTPILMYSEFSSPLPDSIECVVRERS